MSLSSKAFQPDYIEDTTYKEAARNTGKGKKNSSCFYIQLPTKKA